MHTMRFMQMLHVLAGGVTVVVVAVVVVVVDENVPSSLENPAPTVVPKISRPKHLLQNNSNVREMIACTEAFAILMTGAS